MLEFISRLAYWNKYLFTF